MVNKYWIATSPVQPFSSKFLRLVCYLPIIVELKLSEGTTTAVVFIAQDLVTTIEFDGLSDIGLSTRSFVA